MTLRALKAAGVWNPASVSASASALSTFADNSMIADYAAEDIAALAAAGLIQGNPGGWISPSGQSTRAEAAVLLYRILMLD
ncbi:Endo-1,4-beta-xylanase A precursor [compost metagenome]